MSNEQMNNRRMSNALDTARFEKLFAPQRETKRRSIIRAIDVKKVYRTGTQETHALRGATRSI